MWVKILEFEEVNELKNREVEDYVEVIDKLGLSSKNWERVKKALGIKELPEPYEDTDDVNEFLLRKGLPELPDEVNFDSDCDGYDTCWINYWYVVGRLLVFEQYSDCANKVYGRYSPDANATLKHVIKVYECHPKEG